MLIANIIIIILIIPAILAAGIAVFHVIHHLLYCRYRKVPGKSHCGVCGHRKTCRKYHFKNNR